MNSYKVADYTMKALVVGCAIAILLFLGGCGGAINGAVKATNAATVVLYETRGVLLEQGEKDVRASADVAEADKRYAKWLAIFEAFDKLVDAREAAVAAVKAAKAADAAGQDYSVPKLLAAVASMGAALDAFLVAFPEARKAIQ